MFLKKVLFQLRRGSKVKLTPNADLIYMNILLIRSIASKAKSKSVGRSKQEEVQGGVDLSFCSQNCPGFEGT